MKPSDYDRFALRDRLTPEQYAAQQAASTVHWNLSEPVPDSLRPAIDDVVFRRHDQTVRHVVPWIDAVIPVSGSHLIDIGCGCGSSTLAMSHFAQQVDALDVDAQAIEACNARMTVFGADNVTVHLAEPDALVARAVSLLSEKSILLLLGVVEHMSENEQRHCLSSLWQSMRPGQILVVAETPNFYAWLDPHTFMMPFASMVPDALFPEFVRKRRDSLRFGHYLAGVETEQGTDGLIQSRRRLGIGVTHHVFEQAFDEDLNEIIVADGFNDLMQRWNAMQVDDHLLITGFDAHDIDIPIGFARSTMAFIFRKPRDRQQAADVARWNQDRRRQLIEAYSLLKSVKRRQRIARARRVLGNLFARN